MIAPTGAPRHYRPPRARVRGRGRAFCLYRDAEVVITAVSAGRLP